MHSPLLARLLGEGGVGLTLPLPLTTMEDLVILLEGKEREVEQEVREAAEYLGIDVQKFYSGANEMKTKEKASNDKKVVKKTKKKENVQNIISNEGYENNLPPKSELIITDILPNPESCFYKPMISKTKRGRPRNYKRIRYGSKPMSSCFICALNFKTKRFTSSKNTRYQ